MWRIVFVVVSLTLSWSAMAQLTAERQASNRLEKGRWKSAEESLRKALRKNSPNPEAEFLFSTYFFATGNPERNMDSAYHYVQLALMSFSSSTAKEKDRLRRFPLDSALLIAQRKRIDSAAFSQVKQLGTEQAYQHFISRFASAAEITAAIELRNEVAYVEALKANTYQGFHEYINRFPASVRAAEARARYEQLLYEEKTRDGKLESFESYYQDYPEGPYRLDADKNIFEMATASGEPDTFLRFINQFPSSQYHSRALMILYHLAKEEDLNVKMVPSDSLKNLQQEEQGYWVPVLRNGKFGFIDHAGTERVSPRFESILPEYICGNVRQDFLVTGEGIVNRSGNWIFRGGFTSVHEMGSGFLRIDSGSCSRVFHKSGFALPGRCHQAVKMVGHNFVALLGDGKWGLVSLTGKILLQPQFDEVSAIDGLVILEKNGKKTIVTMAQVAGVTEGRPLPGSLVFDDVQRLAHGYYKVRNGSLLGVINEQLAFVVPLDRQEIAKGPRGFILEKNQTFRLSGTSTKIDQLEFERIQFYGNWIRLQRPNDLRLFDLTQDRTVESGLDSLWFANHLAFARHADTLRVYMGSRSFLDFGAGTPVRFAKSPDSTDYFFVPERTQKAERGRAPVKNGKVVFHAKTGARMFVYDFDEIEFLGPSGFLVTRHGKKGLLAENGKVLLPPEYDAILPAGPEIFSLLKDKKFGAFHSPEGKLIKPTYDRNVNPVTPERLAVYRDGAYGFVGWDGKTIGEFAFDEVRPWNDSSVLVKKNFQWMIYAIRSGKVLRNRITDYSFVKDTPAEKVILIHQDLRYGVLSNRRGEIIPPNFSDIVNVGSPEDPLYFAEKLVEEAGIFVVIYYDQDGKLLRKQVYEEAEYEKINCTENN